jgi:tryptophanyl-tRNA synthetase
MEDPKNPDGDNVFAIYSLLGSSEQIEEMRKKYLAGNFGYGHAKQELYELIISKYNKEREIYDHYSSNLDELENKLRQGEEKARTIAHNVLNRVRKKIGYL